MASSHERLASYETTRAEERMDSVVVATRDTIREVTTVTIQLGVTGDTVFRSVVTDRERGRSRDAIATQRTKQEVRVDTVLIEKRDSVEIRSRPEEAQSKKGETFLSGLKWVFAIVVAICVLVIIIKVKV